MVYDTLSDMIIDNRNGLVKEIEHLSAEDKENVLVAFDWLAVEYIKEYISNGMIIEKLKERYTEDEVRAVDAEVGRNFRLLLVAEQKYYTDVEACDVCVCQNCGIDTLFDDIDVITTIIEAEASE